MSGRRLVVGLAISLSRRDSHACSAALFVGVVVVVSAVIMIAARDIHGAAVLAGLAETAAMVALRLTPRTNSESTTMPLDGR